MTSVCKRLLLLAVSCVLAAAGMCRAESTVEQAAMLDFSGLDRFWEVQSTLAAGGEPAGDAWDALFATPGYALLDARERRRRALADAFRAAYRPGEPLPQNEWAAYVVPHLQRVPAMRRELDAFRHRIEHGGFLRAAIAHAQTLLPADTTARIAPPAISFVYFAPDGRGYPRLIVDLLHLLQTGERSTHFLAHELFHSYRGRIARPAARAFGDDLLMWALANAEDEGIADQLDKADVPRMSHAAMAERFRDADMRAYYASYQAEYARAAHWMQFADEQLAAHARDPGDAAIGEALHRGLPDNGRVLGAFMAATIDAELGRDALVAAVGDPIAFWRAYQRAAMASAGRAPPLSDAAMQALDGLERRYYAR